MANLEVYLSFPGTCEEAMSFYQEALGGEIVMKQTFGESPMEAPPGAADRIMHERLQSGPLVIMASDSMPGEDPKLGTNVSLSLNFENENEQTQMFDKLARGGNVTMPLADQFWGARFGMVIDKFGINWMFNCQKPTA